MVTVSFRGFHFQRILVTGSNYTKVAPIDVVVSTNRPQRFIEDSLFLTAIFLCVIFIVEKMNQQGS